MKVLVTLDDANQDPSLYVAMAGAFSRRGWNNDQNIPLQFWKDFKNGAEVHEAEAELKDIFVDADWDPFYYTIALSEKAPEIKKFD